MTLTLINAIGRVRALLQDADAMVWNDEALAEGLRLALDEYRLAGNTDVALVGLDGAPATTLPERHEGLAVWGGAAYAALGRAAERTERFALADEAQVLKGWGDARLREFKGMLAFVFPGYLAALAGGSAGSGADPAKTAAEAALLAAQAELAAAQSELAEAQAAAGRGQEARAEAAAALAAAACEAERARLAELRGPGVQPWGTWTEE
jgi:hypothetical protein